MLVCGLLDNVKLATRAGVFTKHSEKLPRHVTAKNHLKAQRMHTSADDERKPSAANHLAAGGGGEDWEKLVEGIGGLRRYFYPDPMKDS